FNINAYEDEETVRTTLFEGSIKVSVKSPASENTHTGFRSPVILKPGQQAIMDEKLNLVAQSVVDPDKVIAWKDGLFNFEDASLEEVMRQISRWYDLKIIYEK